MGKLHALRPIYFLIEIAKDYLNEQQESYGIVQGSLREVHNQAHSLINNSKELDRLTKIQLTSLAESVFKTREDMVYYMEVNKMAWNNAIKDLKLKEKISELEKSIKEIIIN